MKCTQQLHLNWYHIFRSNYMKLTGFLLGQNDQMQFPIVKTDILRNTVQ